ncbi:DUF1244 domain-containing protein, partial [Pseudomonas aeruginosa]|uniref:DUF1244 domain-containing protein n=1 Tax=Pseudomonas aeruginosa TaxID=287 RepID=UPI003968FDD4
MTAANLTEQQRLELEAAAFRTLVHHLQTRKDVQNIDLMNLAGFCRNCLSIDHQVGIQRHVVGEGLAG